MNNKNSKKYIIETIKSFFGYKSKKLKPIERQNVFLNLVKETSTAGIIYTALKDSKEIDKKILNKLKKYFSLMKESDQDLKEAFNVIKNIPIPKTLIKENTYKFFNEYKQGTRYSCDIDIIVDPEHIHILDKYMRKNNFYLDGIDIEKNQKILKLAAEANRNIEKYKELKEELSWIIEEANTFSIKNKNIKKEIDILKNNLEKSKKELNQIEQLYKKILSLNNFYITKEEKEIRKELENIEKNIISNKETKEDIVSKKEIVLKEANLLKILKGRHNKIIKETIFDIKNRIEILSDLVNHSGEIKEIENYSKFILKDLSKSLNRATKIKEILNQKEKVFHYNYKNTSFVDIHFEIFPEYLPFRIKKLDLNKEKIDDYLCSLKLEDSIILDACHFVFNLSKHNKPEHFQGFLKYLIDLPYKIKNKKELEWNYILEKSKETNSGSQVLFYFKIAKDNLGVPIPEKIIKELKKSSSKIQNIILSLIPDYALLFNEVSLPIKIYSKMYLEKNMIHKYTEKMHYLYNKIFR
ncbi:MAG: hypothetical protein WDZ80_00885 [Candidatus Paceibacterota bacterium]